MRNQTEIAAPPAPEATPEAPVSPVSEPEQLQLFAELPGSSGVNGPDPGAGSDETDAAGDGGGSEEVRGWPCVNCRHRNPHELDVCESCGTAFALGLESSVVQVPGTRGQRVLVAGGAALLFALLFALVLGALSGEPAPEAPVEVVPSLAPAAPPLVVAPTNPADQPPVIVFTDIPVPPPG